jgi:two-component system sensor histidine kinase KdpD
VMINLVENVIRHTPPESPISISAWVADHDIVVEVADRGPGVPTGDEQMVFEKFYRAGGRRSDGGMGLGLTLCRAIISAHEGRIWLENLPAGGAAVRFAIPIRSDAAAEARASVPEA